MLRPCDKIDRTNKRTVRADICVFETSTSTYQLLPALPIFHSSMPKIKDINGSHAIVLALTLL